MGLLIQSHAILPFRPRNRQLKAGCSGLPWVWQILIHSYPPRKYKTNPTNVVKIVSTFLDLEGLCRNMFTGVQATKEKAGTQWLWIEYNWIDLQISSVTWRFSQTLAKFARFLCVNSVICLALWCLSLLKRWFQYRSVDPNIMCFTDLDLLCSTVNYPKVRQTWAALIFHILCYLFGGLAQPPIYLKCQHDAMTSREPFRHRQHPDLNMSQLYLIWVYGKSRCSCKLLAGGQGADRREGFLTA